MWLPELLPLAEYSKGFGLSFQFLHLVQFFSFGQGLLPNSFSSFEDLLFSSPVHIRWSYIIQRLMIALMIIIVDKLLSYFYDIAQSFPSLRVALPAMQRCDAFVL